MCAEMNEWGDKKKVCVAWSYKDVTCWIVCSSFSTERKCQQPFQLLVAWTCELHELIWLSFTLFMRSNKRFSLWYCFVNVEKTIFTAEAINYVEPGIFLILFQFCNAIKWILVLLLNIKYYRIIPFSFIIHKLTLACRSQNYEFTKRKFRIKLFLWQIINAME